MNCHKTRWRRGEKMTSETSFKVVNQKETSVVAQTEISLACDEVYRLACYDFEFNCQTEPAKKEYVGETFGNKNTPPKSGYFRMVSPKSPKKANQMHLYRTLPGIILWPLSLLFVLLIDSTSFAVQWPESRLNEQDVAWLREHGKSHQQTRRAYKDVFADAKELLDSPDLSLTEKSSVPPSGDKRDYYSVSRYWWPDPKKKDGLPWIRKDGVTNPVIRTGEYDSERLRKMSKSIEVLCIAYAISEDEAYAQRASSMLRTFFLDKKTGMRPNFRFSGSVPGVADGRASGLIELRNITRILNVIHVLQKSKSFQGEVSDGMVKWSRNLLDWSLTSKIGRQESAAQNNHGTFMDATTMTLAMISGRKNLAKMITTESLPIRMESQFDSFGKQKHELKRTLSLHYSLFNSLAYLNCQETGNQLGVKVWSKKLEKGIEYAARSVRGDKKWAHRQDKKLSASMVLEISRLLERSGKSKLAKGMTEQFHLNPGYRSSRLQLLLPPRPIEK